MPSSLNGLFLGGVLVLYALPGAAARARPSPPGAQTSGKQLKKLSKTLKLTPEQQQQIAPILEESTGLTSAIRQDPSLSQREKVARNRTILEDSDKKIEAVLDEKQKKTFAREEARIRERLEDEDETQPGDPGPPPDGGPPPGEGPPPDGGPPPE
jgi:Spy/CpxP family protein refolding chaperone